jgi:aspartate-semialdehyde dehydrogenase
MKRISVAVLGATGLVGHKFIELLADHPLFSVAELVASERSKGKRFGDVSNGIMSEIRGDANEIRVKGIDDKIESDVVFSALPSDMAKEAEWKLAEEGKLVISKASANRMDKRVPLMIPEINAEHLALLDAQRRYVKGGLVCDPNCTTIILSLSLKPLVDKFGVKKVVATSMQALSGAGHPGVASVEALGNVIPYIHDEEEKLRDEPKKIFGTVKNGAIKSSDISIFGSCNRVPVLNGHTISVYIEFERSVELGDVKESMKRFPGLKGLHSAPENPILVRDESNRPQPRLDTNGMSVTVGRLRYGPDRKSIAYSVVGDNLVRGAAGAGILDAELARSRGYI